MLGTVFEHVSSFIVYGPLFGSTWHKAMSSDKNSEFWRSKEAESAATVWGSSLISSAVQAYATSALIQLTGTTSYKGAMSLGSLMFLASSLPSLVTALVYEKRPSKQKLNPKITPTPRKAETKTYFYYIHIYIYINIYLFVNRIFILIQIYSWICPCQSSGFNYADCWLGYNTCSLWNTRQLHLIRNCISFNYIFYFLFLFFFFVLNFLNSCFVKKKSNKNCIWTGEVNKVLLYRSLKKYYAVNFFCFYCFR